MKRIFLVGLAAIVAVLLVRGWGGDDGGGEEERDRAGRLAFDRLWIDRVPPRDTEPANVFLVLRRPAVGVFQVSSRWRGKYEIFRHDRGARREAIEVVYPQTGERERITVRAEPCDRGGFDYCLELRGASRGVRSYYSRKEWVVRSLEEARDVAQQAGLAAP